MPLTTGNKFYINQLVDGQLRVLEDDVKSAVLSLIEQLAANDWAMDGLEEAECLADEPIVAVLRSPKEWLPNLTLNNEDLDEVRYLFCQALHKHLCESASTESVSTEYIAQLQRVKVALDHRFEELPEAVTVPFDGRLFLDKREENEALLDQLFSRGLPVFYMGVSILPPLGILIASLQSADAEARDTAVARSIVAFTVINAVALGAMVFRASLVRGAAYLMALTQMPGGVVRGRIATQVELGVSVAEMLAQQGGASKVAPEAVAAPEGVVWHDGVVSAEAEPESSADQAEQVPRYRMVAGPR